MKVQDGSYGLNGAWAYTRCATNLESQGGSESPLPGTKWCKPQLFRWNLTYRSNYNNDTREEDMACEEFGHTLGLRHGTFSDCMNFTQSGSTDFGLFLASHHRSHLNFLY